MFIKGVVTTIKEKSFEVSRVDVIESLIKSFGFEKFYKDSFDGQDGFLVRGDKLYHWESGPGYASKVKEQLISDDPKKVKLYLLLTEAKEIIKELKDK